MRVITLCIALLFPAVALADNSGVWQTTIAGRTEFVSIHQKDGWMIIANLDTAEGTWEASEGAITDNKATLNTIYAPGNVTMEINFISETEAFATLISCEAQPGYVCNFENGSALKLTKIF